jgi:homoserine dehydrogenase
VQDTTGVFADIATTLRDANISIESAIQRARTDSGFVPVVLTTHETQEGAIQEALSLLNKLESVAETPRMIRIESI